MREADPSCLVLTSRMEGSDAEASLLDQRRLRSKSLSFPARLTPPS